MAKKAPPKETKKKGTKPHPGGRPTKFEERFVREAQVLCEEAGFTDAKLARFFNVTRETIHQWKRENEEFAKAVQAGKDAFDSQKVETSLIKRCLGFKYTETTREPCIVRPKDSAPEVIDPTLTITKTVRKFVVPDTTAQIFFLKNRHPERWRDVHQVEHGGSVQHTMNLPPEERKLLKAVAADFLRKKFGLDEGLDKILSAALESAPEPQGSGGTPA